MPAWITDAPAPAAAIDQQHPDNLPDSYTISIYGEGVNVNTLARATPRYVDRQGVTHNTLPSALLLIRWRARPLMSRPRRYKGSLRQRRAVLLTPTAENVRQHFERQAVFFADTEAVVSIYDNHVLVDNDGGIAAVFQDIVLQSRSHTTQRRAGLPVRNRIGENGNLRRWLSKSN